MWRPSYWVYPIISAVVWLATLLGLIIYWTTEAERVHYPSMDDDQDIAYISDVGAFDLKPLFVTGCCLTTVFLDISFLADRWLRHKGRLLPHTTVTEKVLSVLTIVFAAIGTVGLVLLSIYDTNHHPHLHDLFLLLFIAGYVLSAIFICWEYQRLGSRYSEDRVLRTSFMIKLTFILVEVGLAAGFMACMYTSRHNASAIFEWIIAFVFVLYIFSFYIDLYPAVKTRDRAGFPSKGCFAASSAMEEASDQAMTDNNIYYAHAATQTYGHADRCQRYRNEF